MAPETEETKEGPVLDRIGIEIMERMVNPPLVEVVWDKSQLRERTEADRDEWRRRALIAEDRVARRLHIIWLPLAAICGLGLSYLL